jgi:peptidoglycan/LPS O-acetylase OafA/YrhL
LTSGLLPDLPRRRKEISPVSALGPDPLRPPAKESFYRPELDILRFFAFAGVFMVHSLGHPIGYFARHPIPLWGAKALHAFVYAGAYGVDIFFALSAYLITELLFREKESTQSLNIRAFWLRRILRIWPLYYLIVAVAVVLPFVNPNQHFAPHYVISFLFFVGNWGLVRFGWPRSIAVVLWSVSVEEQFYLVWPPILARFSRRQAGIAAVVMIALANMTRLLAVAAHQSTQELWGNSLAHLDCLAGGILIAVVLRGKTPSIGWRTRILMAAVGVGCLVSRGYFVEILPGERISLPGTLTGYPAVSLGCTMILLAFIGLRWRSGVLQYLGKISYGLYVYHFLVLALFANVLQDRTGMVYFVARLALKLGITIVLAAFSYAVFEKPFLRLKRRFTYVASHPL